MPYNIPAVSGSFAYEPADWKIRFLLKSLCSTFSITKPNKTKKKRQHSIECKAQHYNEWKWQRRQKGHRNGDNKTKLFSQFPYAFESIANNKMNEWMNGKRNAEPHISKMQMNFIAFISYMEIHYFDSSIWCSRFVHSLAQICSKHSHDVIIIFMLGFFSPVNGKQPHQTYQSKC